MVAFYQPTADGKGQDSITPFGRNVPQVTELRRQLRSAKATYKVVKRVLIREGLRYTAMVPVLA